MKCQYKIKYSAKRLADESLNKLQKDNKALDNITYHCKTCLGWHIGLNPIYMS